MPTLTDIALDAMGSDKAPEPEIKGAIQACRHLPVRVHLVGPEDRLRAALRDATRGHDLPIVIVPAAEWITMDDKAAIAIRKKPGSTMRVGLRLVKEGKVAGFLTAGNTGAAMALAKMVLGPLQKTWANLSIQMKMMPLPEYLMTGKPYMFIVGMMAATFMKAI